MKEFCLHVAGVSHRNRSHGGLRRVLIRDYCQVGMSVTFEREPDNPFDPYAVGVWVATPGHRSGRERSQIGYVPADSAEEFCEVLDAGGSLEARIEDVRCLTPERSAEILGVILRVRMSSPEDIGTTNLSGPGSWPSPKQGFAGQAERSHYNTSEEPSTLSGPDGGDSSWKFVALLVEVAAAVGLIFYLLYRLGRL